VRDRLIIAIDGPVGAGKSTAGRLLARRLGYRYIDSGAMYRALAWKALQVGLDLDDETALRRLADGIAFEFLLVDDRLLVLVDGREVSREIRGRQVDEASSKVSAFSGVRTVLVARQREMARHGGVVMDGRDIGTVVFPDADVKFFLDARPEERASRRYREIATAEGGRGREELAEEIRTRDARDTSRAASPLRRADDAVAIDTTDMDPSQVVATMEQAVRRRIASSGGPA
jgi:cytidylate kinase